MTLYSDAAGVDFASDRVTLVAEAAKKKNSEDGLANFSFMRAQMY